MRPAPCGQALVADNTTGPILTRSARKSISRRQVAPGKAASARAKRISAAGASAQALYAAALPAAFHWSPTLKALYRRLIEPDSIGAKGISRGRARHRPRDDASRGDERAGTTALRPTPRSTGEIAAGRRFGDDGNSGSAISTDEAWHRSGGAAAPRPSAAAPSFPESGGRPARNWVYVPSQSAVRMRYALPLLLNEQKSRVSRPNERRLAGNEGSNKPPR